MKNLETEYKKQIANEVPDLWARIESSIDAIEEQNKINNNVVSLTEASAAKKGSRIKRMNGILRYSAIVAGAACVLVVVLALSRSGKSMQSAATAYEAASDSAVAESAEETTGSKKKDKKKKSDKEFFMMDGATNSASEAAMAPAESEEYEAAASADYAEEADEAALYAEPMADKSDSIDALSVDEAEEAKEETIQGSSSDGNTDFVNVTGVLTSLDIVEYKGKEIYYATFTDEAGTEYTAFVPEQLQLEITKLEKDKVSRRYVLAVSTGGYYDAEYVYEGYSE